MGINNPITPASIGAVPISRQLLAGANVTIDGGASADLNADVEIASTGGGGGATPFAPWTVPIVADFTAVNLGTITLIDTDGGIVFDCPSGNAFQTRGIMDAAPAAPWDIYAKVNLDMFAGENNGRLGIALRNTTTGAVETFGFQNIAAATRYLSICRWTNVSTYSGSIDGVYYPGDNPWLRLENDGTNLTLFLGDGYNWREVYTETIAAFIGTINEIGFMMQSGLNTIMTLNSFSLVAPVAGGGGPAA